MKKVKGFTLIELIVVIAIIGVLAAILVPAMMGWVMKSRVTTYNNNASELCTQLQIVLTDLEQTDKGHVDNCTIIYDGSTHSLTAKGATLTTDAEDALKAVDKNLTDMSHTKWAAKIKDSTVTAVIFTGNDYRNVGGFPVPCTKDYKPGSKQPADLLACASSVWS